MGDGGWCHFLWILVKRRCFPSMPGGIEIGCKGYEIGLGCKCLGDGCNSATPLSFYGVFLLLPLIISKEFSSQFMWNQRFHLTHHTCNSRNIVNELNKFSSSSSDQNYNVNNKSQYIINLVICLLRWFSWYIIICKMILLKVFILLFRSANLCQMLL